MCDLGPMTISLITLVSSSVPQKDGTSLGEVVCSDGYISFSTDSPDKTFPNDDKSLTKIVILVSTLNFPTQSS